MFVGVCFGAVSIGGRVVIWLNIGFVIAAFFYSINVNVYLLFFRFMAIPRTVSMASLMVSIIWLLVIFITLMTMSDMANLVSFIA